MTKTKFNETEFPLNVIIKILHEGTAEQVRGDFKANRGFGNGTEDHINECPVCQEKLQTL